MDDDPHDAWADLGVVSTHPLIVGMQGHLDARAHRAAAYAHQRTTAFAMFDASNVTKPLPVAVVDEVS